MNFHQEMVRKVEKMRTQKVVRILAVETSCDETSVAVVENGRKVLSNVVSSQIEIHKRFGGVVPEVASRNHIMSINAILEEALSEAKLSLKDIDAVAVTQGAGLVGALLVGVSAAKALSFAARKPLIAVNHIKGHIAANFVAHPDLKPPFCCLVVSGGHTAIVKVTDFNKFELLGTTQDDAIGEAYDKVARVLGLDYPGGPQIDKLAKGVNPKLKFMRTIPFPNTFDMSYSGLKTAVINYINSQNQAGKTLDIPQICASFQSEAVDMLVEKALTACQKFGLKTIALAGGVAANSYLRDTLSAKATEQGIEVRFPPLDLCGDNAAMIGSLAFFNLQTEDPAELSISALPSIPLE